MANLTRLRRVPLHGATAIPVMWRRYALLLARNYVGLLCPGCSAFMLGLIVCDRCNREQDLPELGAVKIPWVNLVPYLELLALHDGANVLQAAYEAYEVAEQFAELRPRSEVPW